MSVGYYHGLLADRGRIEAFGKAIHACVRPGDRVLEIGTGLGTYALFAARAGAGPIWAVDSAPIVHVAEAVAQHNDLADRISFVRGRVPDVALPEPVDLLLFEDFSTRLLDASTWRMLRDAYSRYLAPGARVVPGGARLWAAPVSSEAFRDDLYPLHRARATAWGIDWTPSLEYTENAPLAVNLEPAHLAATPALLAEPRLHPLPSAAELGGTATFRAAQSGRWFGLAFWFDLDLGPGGRVSNAPGPRTGAWGQLFLPFAEPLDVSDAEGVQAEIEAHPLADGAPGWLSWRVASARGRRRGHEFGAAPASLEDLLPRPPAPDGAGDASLSAEVPLSEPGA